MFATLALATCLFLGVHSWPSGAPEKTCSTLKPVHGANIGKSWQQSPFTLTQSQENFKPGEKIRVDLRALPGQPFKGLMLQAYDPATNQTLGKFLPGKGLKTYDSCSAVTHTDRRGKRGAMLIWEAPTEVTGKVAFRGTIVKRFSEFFEGLKANVDQKS